jgi:hypothetical protein
MPDPAQSKSAAQPFPHLKEEPAPSQPLTLMAVVTPLVGWLVPGGGHFLQKRWGRGALLAVSVTSMFVMGLLMQGKVYSANFGDILDVLGFVGDLGAGCLYLLTRAFDWGHGSINLATADYGTKFIIVAGLLNVISAVDAYDIAIGKKP